MGNQVAGYGASPKDNKLVTMMKRLSSFAAIKTPAPAEPKHELAVQLETNVDIDAQYVSSPCPSFLETNILQTPDRLERRRAVTIAHT